MWRPVGALRNAVTLTMSVELGALSLVVDQLQSHKMTIAHCVVLAGILSVG